jgi:hypothetical protein
VEPITVILQTFKRTDVALRTIRAARRHLHYGGRPVPIYVADDGSPEQHVSAVLEACGGDLLGYHTARRGYGGNANAAWEAADDIGALTFWLEDDWELRQPLDLYAYACLLMETEEIGMVRLGALNLDIRARSWAHGGLVYWKLDKEPHIDGTPVFTGHPSLRHRRYRQAYGDYPTGLLPGETELAYAYQFRQGPQAAPGIVWPADYPANGYFGHIGQIKTETML